MDVAADPIRLTLTSLAKVPAARHKVRRLAAPLLGDDKASDVEVMVAEAVGNAFVHGHGDPTVTVVRDGERLRVEVHDDGPGFMVAGRPDHGRGLSIVDAYASRWGLDLTESGTCLWFEVDSQ